MKVFALALFLGCMTVALAGKKPVDLNWHAPEPKPLKDWHASQAHPDGGVNFGVEKRPTFYDNGNLKIQGIGGADRTFGGPRDGNWNARVGGRAEMAWGRRN